jgi:hypothetical protein
MVQTEEPEEWWAAEIWIIESLWSPKGVQVYLTFLVDPMDGRDNEVWAVCATAQRPVERPVGIRPLLTLGHVPKKRLAEFADALSQFRAD